MVVLLVVAVLLPTWSTAFSVTPDGSRINLMTRRRRRRARLILQVETTPSQSPPTLSPNASRSSQSIIDNHFQQENAGDATVNYVQEEPYSLGLKAYRVTPQQQQDGNDASAVEQWVPYDLSLNSDYSSAVRKRRLQQGQEQNPKKMQANQKDQNQSASSTANGGWLEPRVVSLQVGDAVTSQQARSTFIPWNNSYTEAQQQQESQVVNTESPFVLPIPFVPQQQQQSNNYRGSGGKTISVAENILQLGPKMVNDAVVFWPRAVWNATHYWSTNNSTAMSTTSGNSSAGALPSSSSSSSFLWGDSANLWNSTTFLWNTSSSSFTSSPMLLDTNALQKMAANVLEQAESAMMMKPTLTTNGEYVTRPLNNNNTGASNRTKSISSPPPIIASVMTNGKKTPPLLRTVPLKNTAKSLLSSSQTSSSPTSGTLQESSIDWGGRNPSDTLTIKDLDQILKANGLVLRPDRSDDSQQRNRRRQQLLAEGLEGVGKPVSNQQHALKVSSSKTKKNQKEDGGEISETWKRGDQVAFPQPSVLSYNKLKWGITTASALVFMIFCSALVPNLWLVGMILGSFYGYEIGKQVPDTAPTSFIPLMLVRMGNRITTVSLQIYDFFVGLTFMWKTGVLSYEYWKRYAVLDQKFGIQDKMDAWNARFIEGKENFDRWEQENEVGRKVLATLRTAWLVEERSYQKGIKMKKRRRQSKYRLIQLCYDIAFSTGKVLGSILKLLTGGGSTELTEFLKGISIDISQARVEGIGARVGAVMAAIIAINILGSLFTISPGFLGLCAVAVSLIWPTWTTELYERLSRFLQETRAVGRGENTAPTMVRARNRQDKKRFHYYISKDGSKRYYRTGQPFWPWQIKKEEKKMGFLSGLKR